MVYVKLAERVADGYQPLTQRWPVYRIGEIARASCSLIQNHRPPVAGCRCGIYCATARGLAWVPYWDPDCAILLVQPVGRVLTDGRVLRAERVLVLGEVSDVRELLVPPLRKLDWSRAIALLRAAARMKNRPTERVYALHAIWRALGRRITRDRCKAFWRAYRTPMPNGKCPFC